MHSGRFANNTYPFIGRFQPEVHLGGTKVLDLVRHDKLDATAGNHLEAKGPAGKKSVTTMTDMKESAMRGTVWLVISGLNYRMNSWTLGTNSEIPSSEFFKFFYLDLHVKRPDRGIRCSLADLGMQIRRAYRRKQCGNKRWRIVGRWGDHKVVGESETMGGSWLTGGLYVCIACVGVLREGRRGGGYKAGLNSSSSMPYFLDRCVAQRNADVVHQARGGKGGKGRERIVSNHLFRPSHQPAPGGQRDDM